MNLNKNSSTYKFMNEWTDWTFIDKLREGEVNFCQFWRKFIFTFIGAFIVYSIIAFVIVVVMSLLFCQIAAINYLFGEDMSYLHGFSHPKDIISIGIGVMIIEAGTLFTIISLYLLKKASKKVRSLSSLDITPVRMIKTSYNSWKDKYCPNVTVK